MTIKSSVDKHGEKSNFQHVEDGSEEALRLAQRKFIASSAEVHAQLELAIAQAAVLEERVRTAVARANAAERQAAALSLRLSAITSFIGGPVLDPDGPQVGPATEAGAGLDFEQLRKDREAMAGPADVG